MCQICGQSERKTHFRGKTFPKRFPKDKNNTINFSVINCDIFFLRNYSYVEGSFSFLLKKNGACFVHQLQQTTSHEP